MERLKSMVELLGRGEVERALEEARRHWAEAPDSDDKKAQDVVKSLRHLYAHLCVPPVHAFLRGAREALAPEAVEQLRHGMDAAFRKTTQWAETIGGLRHERLARELRADIRSNRLKDAALRVQAMVAAAREDESRNEIAAYLGSTFGTLDHDQDKVQELLDAIHNAPGRFGLTVEQAESLRRTRDQVFGRLGAMGLEGREREFNRALTQGIVDLRNRLTLEMAAGEPTEEETAAFFEELHAIARAVALAGLADGWIDATALYVEVAPRDPRAVGPAAAGEERLFLSLNPRQRLVCVRALRRLGGVPAMPKAYLRFAESPAALPYIIPAVEVMGGLGCREFSAFLVKAWRDKSVADPRFSCVDALGRLEDEAAAKLLMARYRQLTKAKPFDPPKRREAEAISTALGRIARGRTVSPERRNAITREAIDNTPAADTRMGLRVALDFFSLQPDTLEDSLIVWAVERIVQGLWSQDLRPEAARADEGRASMLGFRQSMVDLAVRLDRRALRSFLREIEPYSMRYSGAFYAVAEILEAIGDITAIGLLRKLTLAAWMASDEPVSKYFRDTYYDTAGGEVKPLSRDKVIHALLHAIAKIGGHEAIAFLVETARQVRARQLDVPGDDTASFLMSQLMEHGREVAEETTAREDSPQRETAARGADNPLALAGVEDVVAALRAFYLLPKTRRERKVAAIQEIARRRHSAAIDLLLDQLTEKDSLIRSAAVTALLEFAAPGANQATLKHLGEALLARLEAASPDERPAIRQLLMRLNPRREPFRSLILGASESETRAATKAELSRIIRVTGIFQAPDEGALDALPVGGEEPAEAMVDPGKAAAAAMEARRQYFLARKAWIAGGVRIMSNFSFIILSPLS
ncbi:MAG: HEAT repeat domain-containing protein [Candidatus Sumerlaeota bacterium]|nr:HEAT repeat domain-containing protein [Candidatus Sumerlaeota bacterium]